MEKKKVKTEGSYEDMMEVTNLDRATIEGAIQTVEQTAGIEIEVPEEE